MALIPRLPQELVDHIIDDSRKDKTTLRTLSMVSRSWLPRSHYHLFRLVQVVATPVSNQSIDLDLPSMASFVKMLNSSPNPSVGASVQLLLLSRGAIVLVEFAQVLKQLHRLRTLYVKDVEISGCSEPPTSFPATVQSLPVYENLDVLQIRNCTFVQSFSDILTLITFSHSIQALHISGTKLADDARNDFLRRDTHAVFVRSLVFHSSFIHENDAEELSEVLANGIIGFVDSRSLSSLKIEVGWGILQLDSNMYSKFLSVACARLEELDVSASWSYGPGKSCPRAIYCKADV